MDVKSNHTTQHENDAMWRIKQDTFFRISDQVGNLHLDAAIPASMKNLSLYLEQSPNNVFLETKVQGIYRATRYNIAIKEYVKFDNNNWVIFVDMFNIPDVENSEVTDLNIENPFAAIDKIAVGCVDGQIMIAPSKTERVISLTSNFETKKMKIDLARIREYMNQKEETMGYIVDQFDDEVYLVDSPSPLFAKDTVMYRDSDYVGMWISFGTLLKFDLRNLNVFNIDGVKVGGIDIEVQSSALKTLKMLTNCAYGYASILFKKKSLLGKVMKYSKQYVYETNMEDVTRICVDNILETLQEKGIFGLLYEDFEVIEEFPMIPYDETLVQVTPRLGTVLKFRYKKEYIYMALDATAGKMFFLSYAGRKEDYYNEKYQYNVKVMNDLWITKVNDISMEGFVLFTGFPNLQHNKVLDIYFDDTTESFSSLDKNFAIDVTEFDATWNDALIHGGSDSYNRNTDLIHAYGNNPFPLVSGLVSYEYWKKEKEVEYFRLDTHAEPAISTIIDPENKIAYLTVPSMKTNALVVDSVSPIRTRSFLNNYIARWMNDPLSVDEWVAESEAGSYQYTVTLAYFSNGWTLFKSSPDTYTGANLKKVKIEYKFSGAIEHLAMKKAKSLVDQVEGFQDAGMSHQDILIEIASTINRYATEINSQILVQIKAMRSSFNQEIMTKNNQIKAVIDPSDPKFVFDRFEGSDNIFINNVPTGPVQNHAFLYEDTFKNVYQKLQDAYFKDMDMEALPSTAYCPYIRNMSVTRNENSTHLKVVADMSTSIEMLRNDRIGLSMIGDMLEDNGKLMIGDIEMSPQEAFVKYLELQFFGVKKINGLFMNIFKITTKKKMTEAAKEAYLSLFTTLNDNIEGQTGIGYDREKSKVHEEQGLSGGSVDIEPPEMPAAQPMFIANKDTKLMASLDGNAFVDAPIGDDGEYLTSRIFINKKIAFYSMLRGTVSYTHLTLPTICSV